MIILILLLAFATSFAQFPSCDCGQIVVHNDYTLCYSEKHEQARWVHYKLDIEDLVCEKRRTNDFRSDYRVSTGSASVNDYKGSGYDRGHLAPAADFCNVSATFFMSNMSPQRPRFNRGVWKRLENRVRDQVRDSGTLFVITGPVLHDSLPTIGENEVSIPELYYKVIFSKWSVTAFVIPNKGTIKRLESFIVSVDSVETLTGIRF